MALALEPHLVERAVLARCARPRSAGSRRSRCGASRPRPWSPRQGLFGRARSAVRAPAISSAFCRLISSSLCSRSRSMRAVSSCSSSAICSRSVCSRVLSSASSSARRRAISRRCVSSSLPDALLGDRALLGQARLLDRLARGELRLLRLLLAQRPLAGQLGTLDGAAELDFALLLEPGVFGLAVDLAAPCFCASRFWLRISTSVRCSISLRILRRVSIDLGELRQAFGVEGVRRIEIFEAGLVEVDDRDVLQLQAVGGERLGGEVADLVGVVAALLVHFLERHLRRDRAHRRGELAFEQVRGCRPAAACAGRASARRRDRRARRRRRARRTRR